MSDMKSFIHISNMLGNLNNSYSKTFLVLTLIENSVSTISYVFTIFFSPTLFYYISGRARYMNIVCIGIHLVLTYIERLISTICYFFCYFCWSVNFMIRVCTLHNLFLTGLKIEALFIF